MLVENHTSIAFKVWVRSYPQVFVVTYRPWSEEFDLCLGWMGNWNQIGLMDDVLSWFVGISEIFNGHGFTFVSE